MSRECRLRECGRKIADDTDDLGCPVHWAAVRMDTKRWVREATTVHDYDDAVAQAMFEMEHPPALLYQPQAVYQRARHQFPRLSESRLRDWADRFAANIHLQYIYAAGGRHRSEADYLRDTIPFEPADYKEEPR